MTRAAGHGLVAEGAAFNDRELRLHYNSTGGVGHGLCECGTLSPVLQSGAERKRWHAVHKRKVGER